MARAEHWTSLVLHGLQSAKEGLENYEWWKNADKLKQNCFYLDYTIGGIVDPAIIGKSDWETAHKFIGSFTLDLNELMITIAKASPTELEEYNKEFDVAELNDLFSEAINRKREKP